MGGGNAEDAAEEAGPPPCGGGLLLIHAHLMSSGRLVLPPYGRIYKPKFTVTYYFTCIQGEVIWHHNGTKFLQMFFYNVKY